MSKRLVIFTDGSAIGNPGSCRLGRYRDPGDKTAGDRWIPSVVNRL
jgi:ribonuclease HI